MFYIINKINSDCEVVTFNTEQLKFAKKRMNNPTDEYCPLRIERVLFKAIDLQDNLYYICKSSKVGGYSVYMLQDSNTNEVIEVYFEPCKLAEITYKRWKNSTSFKNIFSVK